jgi:hypothetical protein
MHIALHAYIRTSRVARWFIFIPKFGYILGCLGMKNVGIFNDHLEYFTAIE